MQELGFKICSTCGQQKLLTVFYSKGSRTDASCKECQRKKKRSTYISKSSDKDLLEIKRALGLIFEYRMEQLNDFQRRLQLLIQTAENRSAAVKENNINGERKS